MEPTSRVPETVELAVSPFASLPTKTLTRSIGVADGLGSWVGLRLGTGEAPPQAARDVTRASPMTHAMCQLTGFGTRPWPDVPVRPGPMV